MWCPSTVLYRCLKRFEAVIPLQAIAWSSGGRLRYITHCRPFTLCTNCIRKSDIVYGIHDQWSPNLRRINVMNTINETHRPRKISPTETRRPSRRTRVRIENSYQQWEIPTDFICYWCRINILCFVIITLYIYKQYTNRDTTEII